MRVTILKQFHQHGGYEKNKETVAAIAKSQFEILKFLENHPNVPVIFENRQAGKYSETRFNIIKPEIKLLFPNGLPEEFEALNIQQQRVLATYGAAPFGLANGNIKEIKSDSPENIKLMHEYSKNPSQIFNPEYLATSSMLREFNTLTQAATLTTNEVYVVYGSAHRFDKVANECFPQLELNYQNFDFRNTREEQKLLDAAAQIKLDVDCKLLASGKTAPIKSDNSLKLDSSSQFVLGAAACGLVLYGLFNYCRKPHTNNLTAQNNAKPSTTPSRKTMKKD